MRLLGLSMALALVASAAGAQPSPVRPRAALGLPYRACVVLLPGQPSQACAGGNIVYLTTSTADGLGLATIYVRLGNGQRIGFTANRDSQVRPDAYVMHLHRVDTVGSNGGILSTANVGGMCRAHLSQDGQRWNNIDCDAERDDGLGTMRLRFTGNGQPATSYGQEGG